MQHMLRPYCDTLRGSDEGRLTSMLTQALPLKGATSLPGIYLKVIHLVA